MIGSTYKMANDPGKLGYNRPSTKERRIMRSVSLLGLLWLVLWIAGIIGWVLNIIDIFHMAHPLDSGFGILRIVGIFVAPLGSILGLFF